MSGHVLDLMLTMNARELLLFSRLRTCTRAQWEIRGVARQMVAALSRTSPEIFGGYGPSCAVMGRCPEGRMSCGPSRLQWKTACGRKDNKMKDQITAREAVAEMPLRFLSLQTRRRNSLRGRRTTICVRSANRF